ncbi:hypothetical protein [Pseudooceanicola atlanticus]|uniref:NIPSNAP domain-containing protein n=1 Tax=Pseudooceanicola atlanticus TaxID=1461694 RepID=A0A0A0EDP3_9RHOB|nr:hypothetical protein [Pseudooceanicola atlanticus]KGM48400.1 hypothetical protein ATO9_12205 [Pseudooceanicola atlanticus]
MQVAYLTLHTAPNRASDLASAVSDLGRQPIVTAGFVPQIGDSINRLYLLLRATTAAEIDAQVSEIMALSDVTQSGLHALSPVQERALTLLKADSAMYTNRWFHVRADGAAAFEADTQSAWDAFESGTESGVVGLWKKAELDGVVSYLLIARYADFATWEQSRFWNRPAAEQSDDWVEKFRRRREKMVDSSVIAMRCAMVTGTV